MIHNLNLSQPHPEAPVGCTEDLSPYGGGHTWIPKILTYLEDGLDDRCFNAKCSCCPCFFVLEVSAAVYMFFNKEESKLGQFYEQ